MIIINLRDSNIKWLSEIEKKNKMKRHEVFLTTKPQIAWHITPTKSIFINYTSQTILKYICNYFSLWNIIKMQHNIIFLTLCFNTIISIYDSRMLCLLITAFPWFLLECNNPKFTRPQYQMFIICHTFTIKSQRLSANITFKTTL